MKKRKSHNIVQWYINGERIEVVDNFTYLGVNFTYTGNMRSAVKKLYDQALRAYNCFLSVFSRVCLDVKTKLSLFDALVLPIIMYGSEVWGIYGYKEVDRLHLKFCKHVLGVKSQSSNVAVLGELGRFPLSIICKERSINYWLNVKKNPHSLIYRVLEDHCIIFRDTTRTNIYYNSVKRVLENLGYGYVVNDVNLDITFLIIYKHGTML